MLLLFDIDGTLLQRASGEHAEALFAAIADVHGLDVRGVHRRGGGVEAAGRTDGEIARLLLGAAGVSIDRIDARAEAVRERTCELYASLCPADLGDKVVPGIPALLSELGADPRFTLALVTGNFEPVARLKLRRAGIGGCFPAGQGGFGSDAEDRAALPAVARRRAGGVAPAQAVVIGDTPRDIACARADGCRVIAVTTGPYGADALAGADAVAESTEQLGRLLRALV